ncbi:MAG: 2-oxo acid dehydrogenase subunit E2 [Phycisphaerales bacterium]|nr:2-oxo acid dehydrogenase subunit E2 [Phycisphaerales bacterium]
MPRDFKLPDLGEGIHEAQVVRVLVKTGDVIKEDQPLMEVETDKAAVEIPSPFGGRVSAVNVKESQTIHVGDVIVSFDDAGSASAPMAAPSRTDGRSTVAASPAVLAPATTADVAGARGSTAAAAPAQSFGKTTTPAAPAVRKLAREMGVDIDTLKGSGPGGRVTREDLLARPSGSSSVLASAPASAPPAGQPARVGQLSELPPVRQVSDLPKAPTTSMVAAMPSTPPPGNPGRDNWGPIRTAPLTQIRKTIAKQMAKSAFTIPHVTHGDEADITELERLRKELSAAGGVKLTLMALLVRALCVALKKFPILNSTFDDEGGAIIYKEYVNMGIAVDTDRGLVVPNIRNADRLSVVGAGEALVALANKARANQFTIDELRGGTFTITNVGPMGGTFATPIINHPEVAILGLGRSRRMPVFGAGDVVKAATILPVYISFDHRAIDGVTAAKFTREVVTMLEKPQLLLLY